MLIDQSFLNKHIKESEKARFAGYEKVLAEHGPEEAAAFHEESLPEFVRWYIQKSINSQMRYAEEIVRRQLKAADEKNGSTNLEAILKAESDKSTAAYVMDEYLAEANYKNKAIFNDQGKT